MRGTVERCSERLVVREIRGARTVVREAGLHGPGMKHQRLRGVPHDPPAVPLKHAGPVRTFGCLNTATVTTHEFLDIVREHGTILVLQHCALQPPLPAVLLSAAP